MGQKNPLNERGWESPIFIPKHATNDLNVSQDSQDLEGGFHQWENDPWERNLESSEPLEGTSESRVAEISRDPAMPSVQRRKLDPLPKMQRHLEAIRTKKKRKSKGKGKVETH